MCVGLSLSAELKQELLTYLHPENGIGKADELAKEKLAEISLKLLTHKSMVQGTYIPGE